MTRPRPALSAHQTWVLRWYLLRLNDPAYGGRVSASNCTATVRRLAAMGRLWLDAEEGPRGGERLYVVGPVGAEVPAPPVGSRP